MKFLWCWVVCGLVGDRGVYLGVGLELLEVLDDCFGVEGICGVGLFGATGDEDVDAFCDGVGDQGRDVGETFTDGVEEDVVNLFGELSMFGGYSAYADMCGAYGCVDEYKGL